MEKEFKELLAIITRYIVLFFPLSLVAALARVAVDATKGELKLAIKKGKLFLSLFFILSVYFICSFFAGLLCFFLTQSLNIPNSYKLLLQVISGFASFEIIDIFSVKLIFFLKKAFQNKGLE